MSLRDFAPLPQRAIIMRMFPTEKREYPMVGKRVLVGVMLVITGFVAGFGVGTHRTTVLAYDEGMPVGVDFSPVWRAWGVIDDKFVPAAVATSTKVASTTADKDMQRVYGMISGLADSLGDPYTYFLPPVENHQFNEDLSGKFEGVGMEIAVRDGQLVVVSPLKGSPAESAGLKADDKILEISGESTAGIDVGTAVQKIRGPKGTQVALLVMRDGFSEPKKFEVTRDTINFPTIETEVKKGVFIISVYSFTSNSPDLFRAALREFVESGHTRLILDLRGNPGGYLDAAVQMASWFLPGGKVVVTEDYDGHAGNIVHRSLGYNIFNENLNMVVLVNKGSASASEILADALRHYGVATMVGSKTFGKGSVQELVDITENTSLKITVARWIGPDGLQIPVTGIVPDVEVELTEEDFEAKNDPQMDKAIEVLLKK